MLCVKKFINILSHTEFHELHLSSMTPVDVKQVVSYHHKVHGIKGMIESLDCSHVVWGIMASVWVRKVSPPLL
jgi:hypothetical protein